MKTKKAMVQKPLALSAASMLALALGVTAGVGTAAAQGATTTGSFVIGPSASPTLAGLPTGTAVTQPSLWLSQTAAGATGVQYVVGFRVTSAIPSGSTVSIMAPAGTDLSNAQLRVVDATTDSVAKLGLGAISLSQGAGSTTYNQVTLALPDGAAAGDTVFVELNGVTNPVAGTYGGSPANFTISTSSDSDQVELPTYQVTPVSSAPQASAELSSTAPGAVSQYRLGDLRAESGLNAGSTLEIKAVAGTVLPALASKYSIVDLTNGSFISTPDAVTGGNSSDVTLTLSNGIPSGDYLELVVSGVINPPAGTDSLSVVGDVVAAVQPVPTIISVPVPVANGYWLATASGFVYGAGGAQSLGNMTVDATTGNVVGIAHTPDGRGYWLVTSKGAVAGFGDAKTFGDLVADHVTVSDVVAIAPTADGQGYWLVGRDGGMFAFGDAKFHGSLPGLNIDINDVAGMVASPTGGGYLLVGSDGGVFSFGSAHFEGSLPGLGVHTDDVRAIKRTSTGTGYVLVGSDGGAFVFGKSAQFAGSLPGRGITVSNIVGIALTPDGAGYYMAGSGGTVYTFGDAQSVPTPAGLANHLPVVAIAAT